MPLFAGADLSASDAIFYWQRSTKSFQLQNDYVNPHPFSCGMQVVLHDEAYPLELDDADFSETTVPSIVTLNQSTAPFTLELTSSTNVVYPENERNLRIKAQLLMDGSPSASVATYDFKLFIYPDCSENQAALVVPNQV